MVEMRMTSMVEKIAALQDFALYRDLSWEGSFEDYLQIVRERPSVTRNAFQRVYDMIISYGTEEYIDNKKKLVRYNFFKDEIDGEPTPFTDSTFHSCPWGTCSRPPPKGTVRK